MAFAVSIAHMSDVGGQTSAEGRDLFVEYLQIWPCCLLFRPLAPLVSDYVRRANVSTHGATHPLTHGLSS